MTIKIEISPRLTGLEAIMRMSTFLAINRIKNLGAPIGDRMPVGKLDGPAYMLSLVADEAVASDALFVSQQVKELFYSDKDSLPVRPI